MLKSTPVIPGCSVFALNLVTRLCILHDFNQTEVLAALTRTSIKAVPLPSCALAAMVLVLGYTDEVDYFQGQSKDGFQIWNSV